ncbi:MAG: alpha-ketoacid dehydrogenase subunit beta, partial [Rhodospirillaceae bacterium]|nr:alpha-ketoacid dehydrogenase subunit beta [Rhodospirillaceae bacterium]
IASVKRTGQLCIVHEAHAPCGIGAEIIARVVEQAHGALKAAPLRITPPFAPSPFAPVLEKAYLPNAARIADEIRALLA